MKTQILEKIKTPLEVASDVSQVVTVYTKDTTFAQVEKQINEFGEYSYDCLITLNLSYDGGDPSVGLEYDFEVQDVEVEVINVYDEEGEEVNVATYDLGKIEKLFEKNLEFEIYRN